MADVFEVQVWSLVPILHSADSLLIEFEVVAVGLYTVDLGDCRRELSPFVAGCQQIAQFGLVAPVRNC